MPMRAATLTELKHLRYPIYVSDKIDGIYCALINSPRTGVRLAASKSVKMIPNIFIRHTIQNSSLPTGLVGELVVGSNFQETASGIMSVQGTPSFKWYLHDYIGDIPRRYEQRLQKLRVIYEQFQPFCSWLHMLDQKSVGNREALEAYETDALKRGMEGVMLRSPLGLYKRGLSTLAVQGLLKWKRFTDAEARVTGFTELELSNGGGGNTLGALCVVDCKTHQDFQIGSGFTDAERRYIWNNQERFIGKTLTYKYQNHGIKNKPRAPIFMRWRLDETI